MTPRKVWATGYGIDELNYPLLQGRVAQCLNANETIMLNKESGSLLKDLRPTILAAVS